MPAWIRSSYSFSNGNCVEIATWVKSSHSAYNGDCVEAASYRTSSRSMSNGQCVEVGTGPGVVGARDSRLGDSSPVLEFTPQAWLAFTAALKAS